MEAFGEPLMTAGHLQALQTILLWTCIARREFQVRPRHSGSANDDLPFGTDAYLSRLAIFHLKGEQASE